MHTLDLSLKEITKVEGAATLEVLVRDGKVEKLQFAITEFKRFYIQAMQGKPYKALPQLLARICGTCSNAHLLCSIESCEKALGITTSEQSKELKRLTTAGLMIRDHALHLYLFSLPDMYGVDAFLDLDENNEEQHQHLHDAFAIKSVGNALSKLVAGRSVHAMHPAIGGFLHVPTPEETEKVIKQLEEVRPAVLRLIETFESCNFVFDRETRFMALVCNPFGFLEGEIISDDGKRIQESDYRNHLKEVIIPYSQAEGYTYEGESFLVGSLARINLSKNTLHERTRKDAARALSHFPSTNVYHNNLAQAIEILHCIDVSLDILGNTRFAKEPLAEPTRREGVGVGVIEAPRGTLYHQVEIDEKGIVKEGEIVVPTGQNQINIERDLKVVIEDLILKGADKEKIQHEMEKLIRAYDPCMSCASHFLKVDWDGDYI